VGGYNEQHDKTMARTECNTFRCTTPTAIKLSALNGNFFFKFALDFFDFSESHQHLYDNEQ
jgi:hypothetical protein